MVAWDDGGVRDREPERAAEQGDDGVPIGEPAHRGGGGEGGDVTPRPVRRLEVPGDPEKHRRSDQQ